MTWSGNEWSSSRKLSASFADCSKGSLALAALNCNGAKCLPTRSGPLCAISPDRVTLENEHALAFGDGYPVARGHTLVIPRKHVARIFDLSLLEQAAIGAWLPGARVPLRPDAFTIGINDGVAAGQTVPHAHVHVIPRWNGDVLDPRGGVRWVIQTALSIGRIGSRYMVRRQSKSKPTWTDVKAKLAGFDRAGLLCLVQDLYAAHKDNQRFLHARFDLSGDPLEPYKETIDRWLWPDVLRRQDTSVAKAKKAIADYRKAVGDPAGVAELMVFYCERAAGFCDDVGNDDDGYFGALVRMFEQALAVANTLPASSRDGLIARLARVRSISRQFGYGVGEDMDFNFARCTQRKD
jgi:diadenosine tetraphosphate (Ap4A) HIT family hydrolase